MAHGSAVMVFARVSLQVEGVRGSCLCRSPREQIRRHSGRVAETLGSAYLSRAEAPKSFA